MSTNKTKVLPKTKPSLANKAWTFVSIAGALVAMIYAGLSLQNQGEFSAQSPDSSIESSSHTTDSVTQKVEPTFFNNQQDPSH
ncbi:MAG: hypothetical protein AB8H47_09745 [Bacteroidia bacterium]